VKARHDGFTLYIHKGVFHPLLYFSTRFLYDFLAGLPLEGRRFLELGCGSGLLSLLAHRKGADVTAVDIDGRAVKCAAANLAGNLAAGTSARVLQSDLFSAIPNEKFDVIVINPPYYFKPVTHPDQQAWYCGANGEYFVRLFSALPSHMNVDGNAFMVLEENCDIPRIRKMARMAGVEMEVIETRKYRWETSFIFRLRIT
jgi:release factor glutamine methyltransferase